METSDIMVGLPVNCRMAKDIRPLYDALELEGSNAKLRSRFVDGAVFYERRAKDIARLVQEDMYQLGVLGDDTAIESGLCTLSRSVYESLQRPASPNIYTPPFYDFPDRKVMSLTLGDEVWMTLFARPDLKNRYWSPERLLPVGKIATSYPSLARGLLAPFDYGARLKIAPFDGSIEAVVANREDSEIVGGVDVVRTGDTMRRFNLEEVVRLMRSRIGLWRSVFWLPRYSSTYRYDREARVNDVMSAVRQRLGAMVDVYRCLGNAVEDRAHY